MPAFIDLTGKRFTRLTVLARAEDAGGGRKRVTRWSCRCVCGKTTIVRGALLKSGGTKSCGCINGGETRRRRGTTGFIDLKGHRYGKLTVVRRVASRTIPKWFCICDCGGEKIATGSSMRTGRTLSCGCNRKEAGRERTISALARRKELPRPGTAPAGTAWLSVSIDGQFALVDKEDFGRLDTLLWFMDRHGYPWARDENGKQVRLHQIVAGHVYVDHIDQNPLNCRKKNLRKGNKSQNGANRFKTKRKTSSRYKGVSLCKRTGRWRATIHCRGAWRQIGLFKIEADAARAYDEAALEGFGEYACINFPKKLGGE